ncbi:MAG: response regulator transcription factor [Brucellaceae bacterium]|nr:response regulator transcription factor [Brucellaceae bacterium]
MEPSYCFAIVDDHPLFRGAVRLALEGMGGDAEIRECGTLDDAKALITDNGDIDLMLLDLTMPGVSGLAGLVALKSIRPELPVVIVSGTDDAPTIRRALELGASGFISKSAGMETLREAIRTVMDGGIATPANLELGTETDPEIDDIINRLKSLTPQQTRVLGMLAEGLLNKQIAYDLGVSEATIKAHVSAVLQKLGVDSRTQAVIKLSRISQEALSELH